MAEEKKKTVKAKSKKTVKAKKTVAASASKLKKTAKKDSKKVKSVKKVVKPKQKNLKPVKANKKSADEVLVSSKSKATQAKDLLYWYSINFLKVGAVILAVRMITVISLANLWGFGWEIELWKDLVPVFTFTERNVVLFSSMNAISLLGTTTVLFLLFLLAYTRNVEAEVKVERERFGYYWTVLFLGLFVTLIQFLVSLSLVESIFFTINWAGIIPIFVMLILATVCFVNKRQRIN